MQFNEDCSRRQALSEEQLKSNLLKLKENLDSSNTALEEGRRCVRERTKKELEKRLKERREARMRQLVSEGVSEKEAKKTVQEEYNEIDKNDLKKSEEELKKKEEEEDSALDN